MEGIMAINIKELTKNKSMKMSDGDVKNVVRNYMVKIISDELERLFEEFENSKEKTCRYANDNLDKLTNDKSYLTKNNEKQLLKKYNSLKTSYEFNFMDNKKISGELAA